MNNEKLNNLYKINLDNLFKRLKTQEVIYDVFYNAHINSGSKISIIKLYGKFTFLRDYITIRYGIKKQ